MSTYIRRINPAEAKRLYSIRESMGQLLSEAAANEISAAEQMSKQQWRINISRPAEAVG